MRNKTMRFLISAAAAAALTCAPVMAEEAAEAPAVVADAIGAIEDAAQAAVQEAAQEAEAPAPAAEEAAPTIEDQAQEPQADVQDAISNAQVEAQALPETAEPAAIEEAAPATEAPAAEAPAAEEAIETEEETEDDFIEGSALLSELGYEAGEIDEAGWKSEWLGMSYAPAKGVKLSADDAAKMKEYYGRHGEDKLVANNEFVAKMGADGVIQMMVEVNPNAESAEDVLANFTAIEELELVSKTRTTEVGGRKFLTCTGVHDKEKYMIGACDEIDGAIVAFKIKYKDTASRKTMLEGFKSLVEKAEEPAPAPEKAPEKPQAAPEAPAETIAEGQSEAPAQADGLMEMGGEALSEAPATEGGLEMPEEFEDASLIESVTERIAD